MKALMCAVLTVALLAGCPSPNSMSGPQGEPGTPGAAGATGPAGAQGATGEKGDKGDPGADGATGAKGDKGDKGDPGVPGAVGATGPAGAAGAQGPAGPPGMVLVLDGGVVTGPAGASVVMTVLQAGSAQCPFGGVSLSVDGGTQAVCNGAPGASLTVSQVAADAGCTFGGVAVTGLDGGRSLVCNGAPGATGAAGPAGQNGAAGVAGAQGPAGPAGQNGAAGAVGPQGPAGPAGPAGQNGAAGATGLQGPAGPAGSAGTSVTVSNVGAGNVNCPYGGTQLTAGATITYACNGAPGGSTAGSGSWSDGGTGAPPVTFAGFTTQTYPGNLGTRTGANAICNAEFADSHFCTDWEYDQSSNGQTVPASGAWHDEGDSSTNTRRYRQSISTSDTSMCSGWTTGNNSATTGSGFLIKGSVILPSGIFSTSEVAANNGGCGNHRPLACCRGGTNIVFRGFTPQTYTGNLGTRTGANAICNAAFANSHFCTEWEYDQSSNNQTLPASGIWHDKGDSSTATRRYRQSISTSDTSMCSGWTTGSNSATTGSGFLIKGSVILQSGIYSTSEVAANNGGCGNPRPLACCSAL